MCGVWTPARGNIRWRRRGLILAARTCGEGGTVWDAAADPGKWSRASERARAAGHHQAAASSRRGQHHYICACLSNAFALIVYLRITLMCDIKANAAQPQPPWLFTITDVTATVTVHHHRCYSHRDRSPSQMLQPPWPFTITDVTANEHFSAYTWIQVKGVWKEWFFPSKYRVLIERKTSAFQI